MRDPQKEDHLRELYLKKGLSQRTLAQKMGVSRSRIQRLEHKTLEHIYGFELHRLSKILQLSMDELICHLQYKGKGTDEIIRSSPHRPFESFICNKGQYAWHCPQNTDCFIGSLTLVPHQTLSRRDTPTTISENESR